MPGCNSRASCYPAFPVNKEHVASKSLWLDQSRFMEEKPAFVTQAVPTKNKWPMGNQKLHYYLFLDTTFR